jgi:polyribonucleotide nucleotidyltransferase
VAQPEKPHVRREDHRFRRISHQKILGTMMALPPVVMDQLNGQLANALQSTMTVSCPRSMVGRVIGKGGETIKALQQYTGAMIQIDQSQDPTRVTIAGDAHSLRIATSMVKVSPRTKSCKLRL